MLWPLVSTETTMKWNRAFLYRLFFYYCAGKISIPLSLVVVVIAIVSLEETEHPEGLKLEIKTLSSRSKPQKKSKWCQKGMYH